MEGPNIDFQTLLNVGNIIEERDDRTAIIFRRFDKLAIAYILTLHNKLASWDNTENTYCDYSEILNEYHEAILRFSKVMKLDRPSVGAVRSLCTMLEKREAEKLWTLVLDSNRPYHDLVALSAENDPITRFIYWSWIQFLFTSCTQTRKQRELIVVDTYIRRAAALTQAIVSIGFLIGAMWWLWKVSDFASKLSIVTGFVGLFGLWLAFATGMAKREVFAATAAYAAVLVVYVGKG